MKHEAPSCGIIDFAEIQTPNDFELFVCDLLHSMGYKIVLRPGEGPDGGRDMAVEETRRGNLSDTIVRYLVSCKHFAKDKAVGTGDEQDVPGRVSKYHCHAFLGVYSTHPSNQLVNDCHGWATNPDQSRAFSAEILDGSGIRKQLLELAQGQRLVKQYFPMAALAHRRLQTESHIYRKRPIFRCRTCEIDILDSLQGAIVIEATHGAAMRPSGDPERDLRHRLQISEIQVFCAEHAPTSTRGMPNGSTIYRLENLLEPKNFMDLVRSGLNGMYFWPPHFNEEKAFNSWSHLVNGLFYFVARGRDPHLPLEGLPALHAKHFDAQWTL
jgi:hypothetical protein